MKKTLLIIFVPLITLALIFVVSARSKPLPYKALAATYPVPSFGSLKVGDEPDQDRIWWGRWFDWKGYYSIRPLATFRLAGYVLSTHNYENERSAEAQHSPVDFAMAWGDAAHPATYTLLSVSQSNRFFNYTAPGNLDKKYIDHQTANMHMVPQTPKVASELLKVEQGSQIRFKGYLVEIEAEDGWHWKSSLTRKDSGGGACEIVLVTDFELLEKPKKLKKRRR